MEDKIVLIHKSSQKLKVGVDLPHRMNLLVTEVFDTELIGEGAISVFNHAHQELLTVIFILYNNIVVLLN